MFISCLVSRACSFHCFYACWCISTFSIHYIPYCLLLCMS